MKISVVITAYNCARYLGEALESVRVQDLAPHEILVADDASTDEIGAVIARAAAVGMGGGRPGVRHLRLPHGGEGATRMRGIAAARGDVIAFLDGDDVWPAGRLALLAARLDAHLDQQPAADIAIGRVLLTGPDLAPMQRDDGAGPLISDAMSFGGALIRRATFERVGPIAADLRIGCDIDWFLRARETGVSIAVCDAIVQLYRRHGENVSNDLRTGAQAIAGVLRSSLQRRRAAQDGAGSLAPWRAGERPA